MDRKIEMMKIIVSDEFNLLKDKNQSIEDYQKEKKKYHKTKGIKSMFMLGDVTTKMINGEQYVLIGTGDGEYNKTLRYSEKK